MRQVLHLLFVHPPSGDVLTSCYRSRWVLPVVTVRDRVRAGPCVHRWAADRGIDAAVIGQWFGRVSPAQTDWVMVSRVERRTTCLDPQLAWTQPGALDRCSALLEYQGWAAARLGPNVRVAGPFGHLDWLGGVRRWIEGCAGPIGGHMTPLRTGATEVVLSAATPSGRVFFKGFSPDRVHELRLTRAVEARVPDRVARTVAVAEDDENGVWWLTAACPGRSSAGAIEVPAALAALQQRLDRLDETALPALDLEAVGCWALALLAAHAEVRSAVAAFESVRRGRYPLTWIPMDLDPSNVLVDEDRSVRFIDLDDSFLGPAPLAMSVYATRSRAPLLYRVYEDAWPGAAHPDWQALEVVTLVVEAWLGLRRLQRLVTCGEVVADLTFVGDRLRARLVHMLHGR